MVEGENTTECAASPKNPALNNPRNLGTNASIDWDISYMDYPFTQAFGQTDVQSTTSTIRLPYSDLVPPYSKVDDDYGSIFGMLTVVWKRFGGI